MFRRVLIANRGEIALRIIRACGSLGIETVAVYSEADRGAPWLERADRALCIGPARSEGSYLNADAILQAAEQTECQAIHPGYGFLAENAVFAARCEQQGITFIGPSSATIRRMGDKSEAKRTMARAGLPTIPGSTENLPDPDEGKRLAAEFGYPVLLKATAGGGGKGMRLCANEQELDSRFPQASLEAEKAFGNPALYLEKFVSGGRHIEFQVLCDAYGESLHLGERECSIQRKHQKLVEESPSPIVGAEDRRRLGERVTRAMIEVGYRNAGTVEFLRDPNGDFYFMEMNTRLQVEHPVTEMVTGIDIVAEQLKIAANEPLGLRQAEMQFEGHAIEFRINAEDPRNDFRPDPGLVREFTGPKLSVAGATARWDSAVQAGYRIPPHYDSLLGKLIVHGPDRDTAIEGAAQALDSLKLNGVQTTVGFHRRLLEDPGFRSGRYDIGFLSHSGLTRTP